MNLQIKRFLISATLSTFLYPAISLAADAKTVKMVAKRIIIDNVGLMNLNQLNIMQQKMFIWSVISMAML
ncbi:hypothetical protein [Bathymodiolus platifrons methanotrophic gill symbiont]|uniref:hypothetical protein n=1 Tax=Bathymodiolus platifrons methanotrophic gill symbiont TaxID=113268 RepID=UPI000B412ACB|nr:hypothetical protein [Bathymodiolus platifrons methanotrophic gill symbiont]